MCTRSDHRLGRMHVVFLGRISQYTSYIVQLASWDSRETDWKFCVPNHISPVIRD